MAFFRCGQGSGGAGGALTIVITTTSPALYGLPITISKDGSIIGSTVFDSQGDAEYTVSEGGTYTVAVTIGGSTYTNSVVVEDTFNTTLEATPEGSTVLPVNSVQIWLHCGNVWDKSYTTVSEVLADTTTLLTLINDQNAVDYMVRSTGFSSAVCGDATAMTYIGASNYAAETLLADDTSGGWLEAICSSTYFESVLNVKVPTMTSNTLPSGVCSSNSEYSGREAYMAFDGNNSTFHSTQTNQTVEAYYLAYTFTSPVNIKKLQLLADSFSSSYYYDVALFAGESISDLTQISNVIRIQAAVGSATLQDLVISDDNTHSVYALKISGSNSSYTNSNDCALYTYTMQLYGR